MSFSSGKQSFPVLEMFTFTRLFAPTPPSGPTYVM